MYANPLTGQIIKVMEEQIKKYGLELLSRYPDDLYKHDVATLERAAVPGATIAWMVGHSHTHITVLGCHEKENEAVTYHLNLANDDRFYVLKIGQGNFTIREVDRAAYKALQQTPVPYSKIGDKTNFWVMKHKARVGHIAIKHTGTCQKPSVNVVITPVLAISALDQSALACWASYGASEASSIWTPACYTVADPVPEKEAA